MARVLIFDVNETLLDLSALDEFFVRHLGDSRARIEWFRKVLECAFVGEVLGEGAPFASIGAAALDAIAVSRGIDLHDGAAAAELGRTMRALPAHLEVPDSLAALHSAGHQLVALTNNATETVEEQFANAGIRGFFERVLSADASGHLKPHRAVYASAIKTLGVEPHELRMVAAHDWDVRGAMSAGMLGAYVARPGQTWNPRYVRPDVWGHDLADVARQLMET